MPPFEILYEDNHLLAVSKPVGLPTMGVAAGEPSLLALAKDYIKERYQKPGNVYLGAMSRLDAPVSGIVLFARTSKAAARLTEQFRTRTVDKTYWALVRGPIPDAGQWVDWIVKDERHRKMHISRRGEPGAQEAKLSYRRLADFGTATLIEVELETGRKHQIRLQLSSRGFPILGDRKYGSPDSFPAGIALHARRLRIEHPTRAETLEFEAPLPAAWRRWGITNGEWGKTRNGEWGMGNGE
jgi:23S rRNA pseudouridine1911/1915/1917 synthase